MAGLWDGRRIRLKELHRFANGAVEIAGTLRWDVLRLWSEIQQGLTDSARQYGDSIQSIGVDTWGVDFVLLSKRSELLGQPWHYRDARTRGIMQKTFSRVPRSEIFAATGLQFMEFNTLFQLLAMQKNDPELLSAADGLLMMPDFFHWCLSGVRAAEFTDATTTQFLDPLKKEWARQLLNRFELPTRLLPNIIQPGTVVGPLLDSVSHRTGLKKLNITVPASHDTASAVAAVPTSRTKQGTWAYLSSGTWSLMGLELPKAQLSHDVLDFNLTNEGGVDGTYRLLKNITGLWLVQQCKRAFDNAGKKMDYPELVRLAKNSPGLKSFIDPDDPLFMNPPGMPAAIREFCNLTGQPAPRSEGALVRCALESMALKYRTVLDCLEKVGGKSIEVIHVVGGGSRNSLLNQFTADSCQRPVVAGPVEATVLGNVLLQARASGEISSLADLRAIVRDSCEVRTYEPKRANAGAWQEACGRFSALLNQRGN
jgi:rhamnulokinase